LFRILSSIRIFSERIPVALTEYPLHAVDSKTFYRFESFVFLFVEDIQQRIQLVVENSHDSKILEAAIISEINRQRSRE